MASIVTPRGTPSSLGGKEERERGKGKKEEKRGPDAAPGPGVSSPRLLCLTFPLTRRVKREKKKGGKR